MTLTDRHIVDTYSSLFEGLKPECKLELIERLTQSLRTKKTEKEEKFFATFGAFASNKSPKEIMDEIKSSRKFRKKELKF